MSTSTMAGLAIALALATVAVLWSAHIVETEAPEPYSSYAAEALRGGER